MWMKCLEVDNERGQRQPHREAEDEPTSVYLASVGNSVTVITKFWWTEKNNNTWVDREVSRMLNNRLYAKLCVAGLEKPESSVGEWIISRTRWAFQLVAVSPPNRMAKKRKQSQISPKERIFWQAPETSITVWVVLARGSGGSIYSWMRGDYLQGETRTSDYHVFLFTQCLTSLGFVSYLCLWKWKLSQSQEDLDQLPVGTLSLIGIWDRRKFPIYSKALAMPEKRLPSSKRKNQPNKKMTL